MLKTFAVLACLWGTVSLIRAEEAPTSPPAAASQPTFISADDKAALEAAKGQDVVVEGTIAKAEWSRTGRVMNIEFKDSELLGAVFERNRAKLDSAFDGDLARSLSSAKVRFKGKLQEYGGRTEAYKGRLQIIISRADQVTILEGAATSRP
jgi:DNA/RNA endonuclease YhcR with UshA esterase domain